jgi:glutaredoxin 2
MKLYHYVHCPFCVRVRMALGLLNMPYESIVVPYDDEATPLSLTGKKMLPIWVNDSGVAQNESLDIIKNLDKSNILDWNLLTLHKEKIDQLLSLIGNPVHSLCMPYWIWTPEFNPNSRKYFQTKKEEKRGPFKELIKNKSVHLEKLHSLLNSEIEPSLKPFFNSDKLTIVDIMIAGHLWGMYIFPEFQFSPAVHAYLQKVSSLCKFNYHQDFWK